MAGRVGRGSLITRDSTIFPQNPEAETAAYLATKYPDYAVLAARIAALKSTQGDEKELFTGY